MPNYRDGDVRDGRGTLDGPQPEPAFAAALSANALVMAAMMETLVVVPFYFSGAQGLGAAAVGLVMSAGPVVLVLTGISAGKLVNRLEAPLSPSPVSARRRSAPPA